VLVGTLSHGPNPVILWQRALELQLREIAVWRFVMGSMLMSYKGLRCGMEDAHASRARLQTLWDSPYCWSRQELTGQERDVQWIVECSEKRSRSSKYPISCQYGYDASCLSFAENLPWSILLVCIDLKRSQQRT